MDNTLHISDTQVIFTNTQNQIYELAHKHKQCTTTKEQHTRSISKQSTQKQAHHIIDRTMVDMSKHNIMHPQPETIRGTNTH